MKLSIYLEQYLPKDKITPLFEKKNQHLCFLGLNFIKPISQENKKQNKNA